MIESKSNNILILNLILATLAVIVYVGLATPQSVAILSAEIAPSLNANQQVTTEQYIEWVKSAVSYVPGTMITAAIVYLIYALVNIFVAKKNKLVISLILTALPVIVTICIAWNWVQLFGI